MRRFETPYTADWFAISLRWLVLIGLVVSLGLGDVLTIQTFLPLVLMILWNLTMTTLTILNLRFASHRLINVIIDFTLAGIFFWVQSGLQGTAWWVELYAILTAAIYFEFLGAMLVGLLSAALFYLNYFLIDGSSQPAAITKGIVFILLGILFGFIGRQIIVRMRRMRQTWLEAEDKKRRVQTDRLRAIYELTSTLAATLSYKRVLDSALDMACTALGDNSDDSSEQANTGLVGAVLLFKGGALRTEAARRFTNADMRVSFHGGEGILKKVFDEGEAVLSKDIGYDPELGRVIALRSCTIAYCFPLLSGFNVYGAMLFAHSDINYFTSDRRDMLDIISRQAVIAIQNARLYQDLVEEKERMIEVHEEARKKLARDLHDGPTQSVAAMAMRINLTRRMLQKDVKSADEELVRLEELAHRTTKEIRHMLFTLRPLILESQGLKAALQAMADKMRETFNQEVQIEIEEQIVSQMEMGKQGVIFYIVEEAVNNARKHATARLIRVRLKTVEVNMALLEIADNGAGFDVEAVNASYDKRGSLGMVNLRERAELVNGLLNIKSSIGQGTIVQVYIPLSEEASDRLRQGRKN
jgi:signal transduction histidine kinase